MQKPRRSPNQPFRSDEALRNDILDDIAIVTRSTRSRQEGQSFASCSWHALAFNICFAGWRIVRNRFFDRVIRGGSSARRIRAVGHSRNDQTDAIGRDYYSWQIIPASHE